MSSGGEETLLLELLDGSGRRLELPDQGLAVVGSSRERAALLIEGEGVDDAHCAIGRVRPGGFAIKDLGSRGGTFVNGSRVTSARLARGDVITLGSRRLQVVDPTASDEKEPSPHRIPGRLAGFRIEKLVGRGGMGEVYLAIQENLNRPVALKVLSAELAADRDFVRRLQSEARAAAALSHPNVVVVYDTGEDAGLHYVSMEYMPGGDLEQRIAAEGPLSWRRVLDVLRDAAAGLSYAESKGIVHRDIKPANLMLSASGAVKLADLGLATGVASEEAGAERRTFGTPHFVSPEQARGESVDHRSDLYSLGATAYRLLTGRTPFQGANTREILLARFQSDPLPPRTFVPEIPLALEVLVLKLMAREPKERHASAEILAREVDRIRLEVDHGAPPRRSARRLQTLVGALLLLLLLASLAYSVRLGWPKGSDTVADEPPDRSAASQSAAADDPSFFQPPPRVHVDDADERALEMLELEAKVAYHEIPSSLTPSERITMLRGLAERFAPTATGRSAGDEAARLEAEIHQGLLETERLEQGLAQSIEYLRKEIDWPPPQPELPRPFELLRKLASLVPPGELAAYGRFTEARALVAHEIQGVSERLAREALARAEEHAAHGEFVEMRAILAAIAASYDDPKAVPAGFEDLPALRALARGATARLEGLADEERTYSSRKLREDCDLLAGIIGPRGSALQGLARLDFAGVERDLLELEPRLATQEVRGKARSLAEEFARARGALDLLVGAFHDGTWRRFSVATFVNGRNVARDAVGANPRGLLLATSGGPEEVPWSALLQGGASVDPLFRSRLTRSYSAEEYERILALVHVVTAVEGAREAQAVLDPARKDLLDPDEARALSNVFAPLESWIAEARAQGAGKNASALLREREAALLLAQALSASQEEAWTLAAANAERLLDQYGDTLLIQLLSDGGGLEEDSTPAGDGPTPRGG